MKADIQKKFKEILEMKLKTLLMVLAALCVSLFVVACGETEDTTAAQTTAGANNTTAATTTTKKTTTKKTTTSKVTTTTVTTTLSPEFYAAIPKNLPNNETYTILHREGLDSQDDYLDFSSGSGKSTNIQWPASGGAYGGYLTFACSMTANNGSPNRAEGNLQVNAAFTVKDVKGVLFWVDFSQVDPNPDKPGPVASVTMNKNTYRSSVDANRPLSGIGYYLLDGEWIQTNAVNACRMQLTTGFKGWVYVPMTSYTGAGTLYDEAAGRGIEGEWISNMNLYTDYYTYSDQKSIGFDEILFVG